MSDVIPKVKNAEMLPNNFIMLDLIMAIGVTCPLILYSSTKMPWPEMKVAKGRRTFAVPHLLLGNEFAIQMTARSWLMTRLL